MKKLLVCAASLFAACAAPLAAQDMAIVNATVVTGDGGEPIKDGVVIIEAGRVTYAGAPDGRSFATDAVMDVNDAWVTPGLFATVTTLGLVDVGAVSQSNDQGARGAPFGAALETALALNPYSQHLMVHRAAGITRAATSTVPSASIFAGQGAIIDLDNDRSPVMKANAFQMVALGERGAGIAGGSRTASHALLRAALREATMVRRPMPRTHDIEAGADVLLGSFDVEALRHVVTGEQPLYIRVERASDILQALALKGEFAELDLVLVGVSEGWLVAEEIAAAGVPVIADGLDDLPSNFEQLAATQSNIGRMTRAGVTVAINAAGLNHARRLPQVAGNLVALNKVPGATGLSWGEAFASISSIPAKISGMGDQAGVLKPGALGDVVIWDGDPLELGSIPVRVYIDGVEQDLTTHQSRLRDRYKNGPTGSMPKAFDW
ncbi:MAG: amidohydrolase family protein [Pseudomonadota bacterium]